MGRAQGVVSHRGLDLGDAVRYGALVVAVLVAQYVALFILLQAGVGGEALAWVLGTLVMCGIAAVGFLAGRRGSNGALVGIVVGIAGFYLLLVGLPALLASLQSSPV